jgi:hypothetical protein
LTKVPDAATAAPPSSSSSSETSTEVPGAATAAPPILVELQPKPVLPPSLLWQISLWKTHLKITCSKKIVTATANPDVDDTGKED